MSEKKTMAQYLLEKYPVIHQYVNDKELRNYTMNIKNKYLKKSAPLSQVKYDKNINVLNNILGTHTSVTRVQGMKLKNKHEIRISALFKKSPVAFLNMIVVHELAHLKEKDHDKSFYKLCEYMLPEYFEIEMDVKLYIAQITKYGEIY